MTKKIHDKEDLSGTNRSSQNGAGAKTKSDYSSTFTPGDTEFWFATFNAVEDAVSIVDNNFCFIRCNKAMQKLTGLPDGDLVGKHCFEILHQIKQPLHECPVKKMQVTRQRETIELKIGTQWFYVTADPIFDPDKNMIGAIHIMRNVTDRKNAEEKLKERERKISQKLESILLPNLDIEDLELTDIINSEEIQQLMQDLSVYTFIKEVTSTQSIVVKASENYREMIGIPGLQMEGKNMYELFPEKFARKITDDDRRTIEEGKVSLLDEELNDRFYTTIKFPILSDKKKILAGFTIDDTERKHVEKELRRMNSLLSATLESTADGILTVNRQGRILNYNRKFLEMWQIRAANVSGREDSEIVSSVLNQLKDPDGFLYRIDEMNSIDESSVDIIEFKDGRVFERYSQAQMLDGKIDGRVWNFRDITKQKQAEQTLRENEIRLKELNATKDRLFSIIAHDLRNPFNSILGFSSLIISLIQEKDYFEVERYAQIIQESSEQVVDLLQNLLEWSRAQVGRLSFAPANIDLVGQIKEATELLSSSALQKSISVFLQIPSSIWVYADKTMINTILRNLISNAIKFSFPEGLIEISAEQSDDDLVVCVSDNGVGMDAEDVKKLFRKDKIFSTFGTQREKGTGLGLLLCKEFIDMYNGRIWVESEVGKGSKFFFSIPRIQE